MADVPLREFRSTTANLSSSERVLIVQQALRLLRDVYVHHTNSHFAQAFKRLIEFERRADQGPERLFHDELIAIFKSLRDRHTHYIMPQPFQGQIAFLPF